MHIDLRNIEYNKKYYEFYLFLRNYYIVNLADKEEFKIRDPKRNMKRINIKLEKYRNYLKNQQEFPWLNIPQVKTKGNYILFKHTFYFELQCKKTTINVMKKS